MPVKSGFLSLVNKLKGKFIANIDDIRPQFRSDENAFLSQNAIFQSTLVRDNGLQVGATIDQLSGQRLDDVSGFKEEAKPWYSDQVLPFDITLAGTSEQGGHRDEDLRRRDPQRRFRDLHRRRRAGNAGHLRHKTRCFAAE